MGRFRDQGMEMGRFRGGIRDQGSGMEIGRFRIWIQLLPWISCSAVSTF